MGRSTARLGATASSAAVSSSGRPPTGRPRSTRSPSSAAHGLCSSRASIRRCSSPACTIEHRATKRCPRSPYQRPVTSRRSPAAHPKRSTSKATPSETTSEAGICCRATTLQYVPRRGAAPTQVAPAGRSASRGRARYTRGCAPSPPPLHVLLGPAAALRRGVAGAGAPAAPRARRRAREGRSLAVARAGRGRRRRRSGSSWSVITPPTCGAARRRASPPRGRGATRPRCGSCSTSAAAQPIRGRGSRASYVRPTSAATVQSVRVGRVTEQPDGRFALSGRHAHPHLRDAARHGRAARARRGRRGAGRLGAAPAPAGPARRRAGAPASCWRARRAPRCWAPTAARWPPTRRPRRSPAARRRAATAAPASSASTTRAWPAGPAPSCASATASSSRVKRRRGRSVHATIRPGPAARGRRRARRQARRRRRRAPARRLGARPRRASPSPRPQPPGSTFKIITLSAALAGGHRRRRRAPIRCARPRRSRASRCATRAASRAAGR